MSLRAGLRGSRETHGLFSDLLPAPLGMQRRRTRHGLVPEATLDRLAAADEGLRAGASYSIYRWDSVVDAFTYAHKYKIKTFIAASDTFVYQDPTTLWNNGTTYYRCVEGTTVEE